MRASGVVAICLVGGLLAGCKEDARTAGNKRLDTELVRTLNNIGVENAILAQHTLYPYHFVTDGTALNELGQRDFAVLARHFAEYPGLLNVRPGDGVSAELYQARSRLRDESAQASRCRVRARQRIRRDARRTRPP